MNISHLEKLWCAMYVSEGWYEAARVLTITLKGKESKKLALRYKTSGIIEYDRMLNSYEKSCEHSDFLEGIFIYEK